MAWSSIWSQFSNSPSVPLLTVGVLSLVWYMTSILNDKRPPFPWIRLPLIGNIISLQFSKEKAFVLFYKTSKKPEYDKVFMIKIGGLEFCVINHIELAREALMEKKVDFADRLPIYSLMEISRGGKSITLGQYGPEWRFLRKVAHQALRNFASGEKLENVVQKVTNQAIDLLKGKGNEAFVIKPVLELVQFNIFTGLLFGKEYDLMIQSSSSL
ncbi:hypothetical protein LSH36_561g00065 [Paralvinella palmiformis]|uniref:Cytochrome P450 n=1 Tax=Paralvinella palmiformis TaxID=53620 RepID=A0AAD9MVF9_9ANNE|nr:hypothetical protein LSH36_561g00065 [Paralvinella palmiformis]